MKTVSKITNLFLFFIFFFTFAIGARAADLTISRPYHSEKVSGIYNIQWSVFNTGVPSVPYEIRIKNSACSDAGFAISSGSYVQNGTYNFPWNTATVADGSYCLQVCVENSYTQYDCIHRIFTVTNITNSPPIVTTQPPKLDYTTNEVLNYNVGAYDPDGDPITFKILSAPSFIYLDQFTGRMTLGNYMTPGTYRISFAVIDSKGSAGYQEFTINVRQAVTTPAPTPIPTSTPKPSTTTAPTPSQSSTPTQTPPKPSSTPSPTATQVQSPYLDIVYPGSGDSIKGQGNKIEWKYGNIDNTKIKSILVEYSDFSKREFKEIKNIEGNNVFSYSWDVTDVSNGEYKIRVKLLDESKNTIIEKESEKFQISNSKDQGKVLAAFNLSPENNKVISEKRPVISADFAPGADAEILEDEIVVKLDGSDITENTSINQSGFRYEPDEDMSDGEHTVELTLKDSKDQEISQKWKFEIKTEADTDEETDTDTNATNWEDISGSISDAWDGGGMFACIGIVVLLLLAFVFSLIRRARNNSSSYYDENTYSDNTFSDYDTNSFSTNDSVDDFTVGSHTPSTFDPPKSPAPTAVSATSDDDIPDWLKGDTGNIAEPVSAGGAPLQPAAGGGESKNSTKVHDGGFDLTPN